jgi:hypothetical protein
MQKACSVTVVVASKVHIVTGRSFLVRTQQEGENYGLYSYLLLGSKASDETGRKRHLKVIRAYLSRDTTSDLEKVFPHRELNVTYLLLKTQTRELVSAESILEDYDYPLAKLLLSALPGNHMDGPFLVSSLVPLTSLILKSLSQASS